MLYNEEVEQLFLGCLLHKCELYDDVSFIDSSFFYLPIHGRIFDLIKKIIEENNIVTVNRIESYLEKDKELPENYIRDLVSGVVSTFSIKSYAQLIHDLHVKRSIKQLSINLNSLAEIDDPDLSSKQILAEAEKFIYESQDFKKEDSIKHISHNIDKALEEINNPTMGVLSGITYLDRSIRGFKGGGLYTLAGRPSMGKTALGLTLAVNTALYDKRSLFFSLEMPHIQLIQRIMLRIPNVEKVSKIPFHINDSSGLTISDICSQARRHKRKHGLDILFVDYLGLIASEDKRINKVHQIEEITTRLKGLAKDLDIPVVLLCQLSRALELRDNKRPMLSDLRDSGSIEQDSDVVIFLYREYYYAEREKKNSKKKFADEQLADLEAIKDDAELIIAKNRHGKTETLNVKFHADKQYFGNVN